MSVVQRKLGSLDNTESEGTSQGGGALFGRTGGFLITKSPVNDGDCSPGTGKRRQSLLENDGEVAKRDSAVSSASALERTRQKSDLSM